MYVCEFCGRTTDSKQGHINHVNHCELNPNRDLQSIGFPSLCRFCGKECKNNNSFRNHERLCKKNPDRQLTAYEKYGLPETFNTIGIPAWNKGLTKESDQRVLNRSITFRSRFQRGLIKGSQTGKHRTEEERKKISSSMLKVCSKRDSNLCGKGKRGTYRGIYCQSSWELAYVLYCFDNGINFIRNKEGFKYTLDGKERTYFPDFYLPDEDTYVEIKGYYDKKSKEKKEQFIGNLVVLQLSEMEPILNYVDGKYGKDFTKLYEL